MALPDWVNMILTNEFDDDNYWFHTIDVDCPEAYTALMNIQRSPSDIYVYQDSVRIYDEYIDEIINYYGGMTMINAFRDEYGEYPPGYFPRPKLKLKKKNLTYIKSGQVPPKTGVFISPVDRERLKEFGERQFDNGNNEELTLGTLPKGRRKAVEKTYAKTRRVGTGLNDIEAAHLNLAASYDPIIQYFSKLEGSTGRDSANIDDLPLDKMADIYDRRVAEEDAEWKLGAIEDPNNTAMTYVNNRFIRTDNLKRRVEWSQVLLNAGFEKGLRKYLKTMNPHMRKAVANEIGYNPMSKKELKKSKKKWEKYQKGLKESRTDNLRTLAHSLSRHSSGVESDVDSDIFESIIKKR